jgi:hypothetical protein
MVGVVFDMTERKEVEQERLELSRRLIKAQEDERTRLARELHDDFSQRVAIQTPDWAITTVRLVRVGRITVDNREIITVYLVLRLLVVSGFIDTYRVQCSELPQIRTDVPKQSTVVALSD